MYERIVSLYGKNVRSHLAIVYVYYVNASGWYNVLLVDIILQYRTKFDNKLQQYLILFGYIQLNYVS